MATYSDDENEQDPREFIWLEYEKFAPENHKVSSYITSLFSIQTCEEGLSWKYVTTAQRQWYWDEFVKYRWEAATDDHVKRVWYINTKELYRQTIHNWRSKNKHPDTVTEEQWARWKGEWDTQSWKDKAAKNKANKHSEPAGPGTGQTKHSGGSKSYAMHVVDLEQMEVFMEAASTQLADGTVIGEPTSQVINEHFKTIIGGPVKGRMYGLSTVANTLFPTAMAPRRRGLAGASQYIDALRDEARTATQISNEADERAQTAERRANEADERAQTATRRANEAEESAITTSEKALQATKECETLSTRLATLEESFRLYRDRSSSSSGQSSHGRGLSHAYRVNSAHTGRSSQGSRDASRGSPAARGSPASRYTPRDIASTPVISSQRRTSSFHVDPLITNEDNEYDDDETQP
ncbi:uncharacterized protein [Henckelia pumila]|uniref:uncharacterized protein isoform X2 n=1 Tax=Henckelia pumila TaxID=405737 RepID=UPI003C6DC1A5